MPTPLIPSEADALAEWARRVRANAEQVERYREEAPATDFYAPVAQSFAADPRRLDEPVLDILRSLVEPGETWLDIGAGGGRYALPLALLANEVVAIDPSDGMLDVLRAGMEEHGIRNIRIVQDRWPMPDAPRAEVAFIANVGYDIADIGPFLDAMEASATRQCVAVLLGEAPATAAAAFWPAVHGVERELLPGLPEFLSLLMARGRFFEVRLAERGPGFAHDPEGMLRFLRQQLWVAAGGEKDQILERTLRERGDEIFNRSSPPVGVVTWKPR